MYEGRPARANRGQGGHIAQLEKAVNSIRPDLIQGASNDNNTKRQKHTKFIPEDIAENPMAPNKQQRTNPQVSAALFIYRYA